MSVTLQIYVEDIATVIADGYTSIRLYRSTSPDGTFSLTGDTATLVAAQEDYEIEDSTGTVDHWYRYDYYTGAVASAKSPSWKPEGTTWKTMRMLVASDMGAGFASTCTAAGTVSSLVDATLKDDGLDEKYLQGLWVYRADAAAEGDKLRRVNQNGFSVSASALTPTRAWTNAPANGEAYQVFAYLPPVGSYGSLKSWNTVLNEALRYPVVDQLNLGPGTTTGKQRFSLGPHLWGVREDDIRKVMLRTYDENDLPTDFTVGRMGTYWYPVRNGPGDFSVHISPSPGTDQHVFLEVNRSYEPLYDDDDITDCPQDLLIRCAVWRAYLYMERLYPKRYTQQVADAFRDWDELYSSYRPDMVVSGL